MRLASIIATGLLVLCVGSAHATPLTAPDLNLVYRSCMARAPAGLSAAARARYCGCFRDAARRIYTRETLAGVEARLRARILTTRDRERIGTMASVCSATQIERPPAPPPARALPESRQAMPTPRPVARAPRLAAAPPVRPLPELRQAMPTPPPLAPTHRPPAQPALAPGGTLTEAELDAEQRDCLATMAQSAPGVSAEVRQRFCSCGRAWMQRNLTRAALEGINARQRANTPTALDRAHLEELGRVCMAQAQEAPPAPPISTPPAPQRAAPPPAPQRVAPTPAAPQVVPVGEAELDAEERSCLASMERSAPNVSAPTRQRFCGCVRGWLQRTFTQGSLAAFNARLRGNSLTMLERDQVAEVQRACFARAQEAPVAPAPVSTPPASPTQVVPPAPQPVTSRPAQPRVAPPAPARAPDQPQDSKDPVG